MSLNFFNALFFREYKIGPKRSQSTPEARKQRCCCLYVQISIWPRPLNGVVGGVTSPYVQFTS